jgi:hypothetical protein
MGLIDSRQADAAPRDESATARARESAGMSKWTVAAIVGTGVFMATLDSSIVNISLPVIAHSFGVGLSGAVERVIIAYLVATAAVLLITQRSHHLAHGPSVAALQHSFVTGFHGAFVVCAVIAALGVFSSFARGKEDYS